MSEQIFTLASLSEVARRTAEEPPRVSVYDVIAAAKGCDGNIAGEVFRRMLQSGTIPKCEEVPQSLIQANCLNQTSRGGARKPVVVATAEEIVQILWALPGTNEFRKNCADVVVKYLGGDLRLVEKVFRNREVQEQMAATARGHPARIFGQAVEASSVQTAEASIMSLIEGKLEEVFHGWFSSAESRFKELVRKEFQQTHPWDFHKRAGNQNSLVEIGVIVEGEELTDLDNDEHVVRIVDFLKERLPPDTWKKHGNKLKNIFATELKKHKIEQCEADGHPPFIARNQGEYRIIYTEADQELMTNVFHKCKRRFNGIVTRDEALVRLRQKQRRIEDYFTASAPGHDDANERQDANGNRAPSTVDAGTGTWNAPTGASTVRSDDCEHSRHRGDIVVMHRDAVAEAPANLRVAAKRGDADVSIKE